MNNTRLQMYKGRNLKFKNVFKNVFKYIDIILIKLSSIEIEGDEIYIQMMDSIVYLTNEIYWLIIGGFSEGAYARLRLLHEYIAKFTIIVNDEKEELLIKRYKLNNYIYEYRKMKNKEKIVFKYIKNYAISNSLLSEFNYLMNCKYVDCNWWFEILLDNKKSKKKIGFSQLNDKFSEIQNELAIDYDFKSNGNIIFEYTSEKVHMFSSKLDQFIRLLIVKKDIDEKLYLDDIINIIQLMTNELAIFLYINFQQEKEIIDFVFKYQEKINFEIDKINEKYGC